MRRKITLCIFSFSVVVSLLLYFQSKNRLEIMLTAKEWKHNSVIMLPLNANLKPDNTYLPIEQIHIHSSVRYLSNGNYVKSSALNVYLQQEHEVGKPDSIIRISESGTWQLVDNYLLIDQTEIQELPTIKDSAISAIQAQEIKQRYVIEGQQSKRIDIISESSMLITSLNQHSQILYAD